MMTQSQANALGSAVLAADALTATLVSVSEPFRSQVHLQANCV